MTKPGFVEDCWYQCQFCGAMWNISEYGCSICRDADMLIEEAQAEDETRSTQRAMMLAAAMTFKLAYDEDEPPTP